ncbi:MAG: nucleoside deaminase [Planctomycetota bacterium]
MNQDTQPQATPKLDHPRWMREAIASARDNPAAPFGAVLVDPVAERVVATGCNDAQRDPTLHGEVDCIRNAWSACAPEVRERGWLYTTAEPCPMCMSACAWAQLAGVVFGTSIPTLIRLGWYQIDLRAREVAAHSGWSADRVVAGVLETECDALFQRAQQGA